MSIIKNFEPIKNLSLKYAIQNILPVATHIIDFVNNVYRNSVPIESRARYINAEKFMKLIKEYTQLVDDILNQDDIDTGYFGHMNPITQLNELSEMVLEKPDYTPIGGGSKVTAVNVTDLRDLFHFTYPLIHESILESRTVDGETKLEYGFNQVIDVVKRMDDRTLVKLNPSIIDINAVISNGLTEVRETGLLSYNGEIYAYGLSTNSVE